MLSMVALWMRITSSATLPARDSVGAGRLAILGSSDTLRPSLLTLSMLSRSRRSVLRLLARQPKSVMKSLTSWLGVMVTMRRCPPASVGSAIGTSSRVTTSVNTEEIPSSSERLQNLPTLVTGRRLVPVALTSTVLTVVVKVAAHALMLATPASSSRSGRRKVCMTHNSPMLLAIGVPVAKVATRSTEASTLRPAALASSRRRRRSTMSFIAKSSARIEGWLIASSWMWQVRALFLDIWASSILPNLTACSWRLTCAFASHTDVRDGPPWRFG
jgi:hypothetical protein